MVEELNIWLFYLKAILVESSWREKYHMHIHTHLYTHTYSFIYPVLCVNLKSLVLWVIEVYFTHLGLVREMFSKEMFFIFR